MQCRVRERGNEFENEVTIAGGVDAVGRGCVELQLAGHLATIERQRGSSYCA